MRPEQSVSVLQREKRIKELRELFFQLSADEQLIARSLYQCLFGITKLRSSRLAWPHFGEQRIDLKCVNRPCTIA